MRTPTTRRAEAFADALDRAAATGAVDAAAVTAGVAPLVLLVGRMTSIPQRAVGMAPGFRDALMAQAATTLAPAVPPPPVAPSAPVAPAAAPVAPSAVFAGPVAQLAAGALSVAVAMSGVGAAAHRSVPGDAFYGVKRLVERLQRDLAGSAGAEAAQLADEAQARLGELRRLLEGGISSAELARVERLVADLDAALSSALDRLAVGEVPAALLAELAQAWNTLAGLVPQLPATAQASALSTLAVVNNRLGALVDGASPVNGGNPPAAPVAPAAPTTPVVAPTAAVPTAAPSIRPTAAPSAPVVTPIAPVTPTTLPSVPATTTPLPTRAPVPPAPALPTG